MWLQRTWVINRVSLWGGRLAYNYRSRKQNRIFQPFGRLFLSGTLINVSCSINELLVIFREESIGIGRFCRLEFQRMANWLSFDKKIEFYPYEGYRSVTTLDAARVNRTISHKYYLVLYLVNHSMYS